MSAFDIEVKKIKDTWSTRVTWQSGTDSQLLKEIYDIYQKWGMASYIPAIEAVKHVFAQDVQKSALIETATAKVAELRKLVKDTEAKAAAMEETKTASPSTNLDITEVMITEKVKETKTILLEEAKAAVVSLEAEVTLARDQTKEAAFQAELKDARIFRAKIAREIALGRMAVTQQEIEDAVQALVGTSTLNAAFQQAIARIPNTSPRGAGTSTAQPLTAAEAQKTLKNIWCQTIRVVILQNGQKDVGKIEFGKTEETSKGKLALSTLVHTELAQLIMMKIAEGETVADFTSRLQTQERFMRWVISTMLQQVEEAQYVQIADTQFFMLLKTALPERMEYMGSNVQGGFTKLCSMVLESSASPSQNSSTPKKVAFVSLGGKLSRQPGAKITGETRTEKHNKTVVTSYKPKEKEEIVEDTSSGEEEGLEEKVRKIIAEQMSSKEERSPAKSRSSTLRDDQEAPEKAEKSAQEQMISLLKELVQAKTIEKKFTNNECFTFANTGSCLRGSFCKFTHGDQAGAAPPPYPQNPKRSRQESPPQSKRNSAPCFDFQRGKCARGAVCTFSHEQGGQATSRRPAIGDQGRRDCEKARRTGVCGNSRCTDYHGKTSQSSQSQCKRFLQGGPCHYQWTPEGCNFSHNDHVQEDRRRPEHRDEKNGRGSGRADRFKR